MESYFFFAQYFKTHFNNERYRYVGWELSFGKAKEVIIGNIRICGKLEGLSLVQYLLELLLWPHRPNHRQLQVIGPMDHKTTAYFDGNESIKIQASRWYAGICICCAKNAWRQVLQNRQTM